jgi:hypothetical protein
MTLAPLLLGVDTGGTFTDFVLWNGVALPANKYCQYRMLLFIILASRRDTVRGNVRR